MTPEQARAGIMLIRSSHLSFQGENFGRVQDFLMALEVIANTQSPPPGDAPAKTTRRNRAE